LGAAYYFIPKIIGKPVYSYSLSLIGFWRWHCSTARSVSTT
jgi:cbb3-type cytochrome oxidase subunit 1